MYIQRQLCALLDLERILPLLCLELNEINVLLKSMSMNRQFRLSLKSGNINNSKRKEKSNRELKTAVERRKGVSSYKEFRIPKNGVALMENRASPILHQNLSSCEEHQNNLLTKSMEKIKIPKTQRTMAEQKQSTKEKNEMQNYLKERQEHTTSHWSSFSRRNVQFLSKKMKNIRFSNYASVRNQQVLNEPMSENQKIGNLLESFVCKSLEPHLIAFQKANPRNNSIDQQCQIESPEAEHFSSFHKDKNKADLMILSSKVLKQTPKSAMSNEFHTKIKKKCLQNNPHILASIIKRKHERLCKQDLYQFVQKMIHRSKNNQS